ncbi:dihydrofolate reductase [Paenibacillus allorhizosphaerae]|uniref:Dihydrofolate reductase n=1 Tax=Paenibacillus allorhizosphaerae TaxID=2849866 RepID=A0ABN7TPH6_9BACL|nr:dihydrofolate reductase [Paenibacillus allorhizosphaerae]CAG7649877.1 IS1595 family transposase ISSsu9 [Paenibacillus allorhizosphaerae]
MILSIIVAMGRNRAIGKNNSIPWRLPKEQAYLRNVTMGKPIIMGRKNYESIGKPLDGRTNIVLTRKSDYKAPGCVVVHSAEEALKVCAEEAEAFIFGGEEIYRQFLPLAQRLYLTVIDHHFDGDTFFPEIDLSDWTELSVRKGITDANNPYDYHFYVYERTTS